MHQRTSEITTLLFDWDGTLVDSARLGLIAFQKSFATLGLPFDEATYEATYSPNWYSIYEAMNLPPEKWELADELWVHHYGEQSAALVEGGRVTIDDLRRKGYRLGIVSSGSTERVCREISNLALEEIFEVVVCNEQMVEKKPHPEGLHTAMDLMKCSREQACYVGDSPEDIQMGKSANVFTIGVRSAYPTSWKLLHGDPDIYIDTLNKLCHHFGKR